MSKTLSISVSKSDVLLEVGRLTSYIGKKKSAEEGVYDTIAAIKADDIMLGRMWDEGCEDLTHTFKHFISSAPTTSTSYSATCTMTDNWDSSLSSSINKDSFNFLAKFIVSRWMRIVKPDEEEKYATDANAILNDIYDKLFARVRPTRVFPPLPDDITGDSTQTGD